MNVTVVCSDGFVLGEYEVKDGRLKLRPSHETTIWGREAKAVHDACRHIEALKSGRITTTHEGSFLDDGTPLTDEIMVSWGWRETETGWENP